jgi:hypothetical protein
MVKRVGFIYDGETEEFILKSPMFHEYIESIGLRIIGAIKYKSGKLSHYSEQLLKKEAERVIILTDMEQAPCFTEVFERYREENLEGYHKIIVVKRMGEAWLLADTNTLKGILRIGRHRPFHENNNPEAETNPCHKINELLLRHTNRTGNKKKAVKFTSKPLLAKKFLDNGFTIEAAVAHPRCMSAKYFDRYLRSLRDE